MKTCVVIITWNIPTLISYCGPKPDDTGSMAAPSAAWVPVCTNPGQVRSKQPVDVYESLYTKPKTTVFDFPL